MAYVKVELSLPSLKKCGCGSERHIQYQCKVDTCANKAETFYCHKCFENGKHFHFPAVPIAKEVEDFEKVRFEVYNALSSILNNNRNFMRLNGPLIEYLDSHLARSEAVFGVTTIAG